MNVPRKLTPGENFDTTARTHGAFIDAIKEVRTRQQSIMPGEDFTHTFPKGNIIQALNQSDQIVPWYGVLELGEPRHQDNAGDVTDTPHEDLFKTHVYIAGHSPTGESDLRAPIGIAQSPINRDCVGDLLVEGITQAVVYRDPTTEIEYKYAMPIAGDVTKLQIAIDGPVYILWREEGYGDKWALVWLNKPRIMRVELKYDELFMPKDNPGGADGDTSVVCHLADGAEEREITVWKPSTHHEFGIGRGGSSVYSRNGAEGYIIWSVERARWEFLVLNAKLISEAVVTETDGIAQGSFGTVELYWENYANPYPANPPAASGEEVEALNWCGPNPIAEYAKVIVSYDRHEARWVIIEA